MGSKSDEDLINLFLATGDKALIDDLFRRYRSLVFGVCTKFLDNKEDSLDVTMLVFEKILRLETDKKVRNFPNWLFTMTKNTCIDYVHKQKRTTHSQKAFEYLKNNEGLVVENEDIDRLFNEDEHTITQERIEKALTKLDARQRQCIELFYFKKMSYKEIETLTGIPAKQVKSLLQNGKRKLKRILLNQITRNWKKDN